MGYQKFRNEPRFYNVSPLSLGNRTRSIVSICKRVALNPLYFVNFYTSVFSNLKTHTMNTGYMYLLAIMDLKSRYIVRMGSFQYDGGFLGGA